MGRLSSYDSDMDLWEKRDADRVECTVTRARFEWTDIGIRYHRKMNVIHQGEGGKKKITISLDEKGRCYRGTISYGVATGPSAPGRRWR